MTEYFCDIYETHKSQNFANANVLTVASSIKLDALKTMMNHKN